MFMDRPMDRLKTPPVRQNTAIGEKAIKNNIIKFH